MGNQNAAIMLSPFNFPSRFASGYLQDEITRITKFMKPGKHSRNVSVSAAQRDGTTPSNAIL